MNAGRRAGKAASLRSRAARIALAALAAAAVLPPSSRARRTRSELRTPHRRLQQRARRRGGRAARGARTQLRESETRDLARPADALARARSASARRIRAAAARIAHRLRRAPRRRWIGARRALAPACCCARYTPAGERTPRRDARSRATIRQAIARQLPMLRTSISRALGALIGRRARRLARARGAASARRASRPRRWRRRGPSTRGARDVLRAKAAERRQRARPGSATEVRKGAPDWLRLSATKRASRGWCRRSPARLARRRGRARPSPSPAPRRTDGRRVRQLKGRLRLPVRGELSGASALTSRRRSPPRRACSSGRRRASGPGGGRGRVVYADWMRGFGNLLIVDHGEDYLTIYAQQRSRTEARRRPFTPGTHCHVGASGGERGRVYTLNCGTGAGRSTRCRGSQLR